MLAVGADRIRDSIVLKIALAKRSYEKPLR